MKAQKAYDVRLGSLVKTINKGNDYEGGSSLIYASERKGHVIVAMEKVSSITYSSYQISFRPMQVQDSDGVWRTVTTI